MPDYQKGKIYKIYSPSKNLIYIGSTTQTLPQRLSKHLSNYKAYNKYNTKNYSYSFLVLECEDYKIELLEEYACNNRQQLEKKEGEFIKNNECCNNNIAGRSSQEYRLDNVEKAKQYYIDNADKLKQYRLDNADKLKQYRLDNVEKAKQYRIDNKDEIKAKKKQYRLDNKEKRNEYNKQYYQNKKNK
jgi:hypothetical protein